MSAFPGDDMGATLADEKPHVVCVPFPSQGHITPMMKLAKVLHRKGFHITFVNTEYNQRRLVRSRGPDAITGLPDFRFATIPDGMPLSDADATQDPESLCYSTMTTCLPHLKNLLHDLNNKSGTPLVRCVVADGLMSLSVDAVVEIGVPCALFWTASACGYMGYHNFRFLIDEGLTPLKDKEQVTNGYMDTPVTHACGMSKHMRLRDFPSFIRTTNRGDVLLNFMIHQLEQSSRATAIIVNTFDELEQPALDAMCTMLPLPIYTIGPLNFLTEQLVPDGDDSDTLAAICCNLWREDRSCLEWLQGREPRSVVYVNFGSITTMSSQELVEFAWGLANCGYDFLWIVRNDLVKGDVAVLPPEFQEATKGRCLLASWCDQEAVLHHEAVGAFLTHCGWNSMMEGLSAGVPMLCWPFFAEQQTNSRYVFVEWGVGMEVGDDVRREVVEERIREVMGVGEAGREMRRKAVEWSEIAVRATAQPGGRSLANLESLLQDVLLSAGKNVG
ncbi:7-deoxyloganetin glucosyltransferase-like [Triticum dicoccoides]|uniref:7-deoxyloganetin glucosyltransferase-like n=1 Tax=Triticum dicoccoides TaxID=85692 RepID=UPI00188DEC9C|nr:7-deoxyloganetin glucosyltransferase-like [Triticum dicoccoides]